MTSYLIIGIVVAFGLYLLFSKRSQKASLQSALNPHVSHDHSHSEMDHHEMDHNKMDHNEMDHSEMNHSSSGHNHKGGHGCCG
ncbi:hypothetical protein MNBD_IGNAVI01-2660 [hydrothermal vent metagenome]|uniref:Uncharacterized protein n=1 Tax=hydrothermal vent metagenome TaxID=652676 RepID=A0A3B1BES4_9ZZZZ